jgi:hypothetical protein
MHATLAHVFYSNIYRRCIKEGISYLARYLAFTLGIKFIDSFFHPSSRKWFLIFEHMLKCLLPIWKTFGTASSIYRKMF